MRALIRTFVHDLHASPNKTNADKQTALHLVCMRCANRNVSPLNSTPLSTDSRARDVDDEIRSECIDILLQWKDENDPIDIEAKDAVKAAFEFLQKSLMNL